MADNPIHRITDHIFFDFPEIIQEAVQFFQERALAEIPETCAGRMPTSTDGGFAPWARRQDHMEWHCRAVPPFTRLDRLCVALTGAGNRANQGTQLYVGLIGEHVR